MKYKKTNTILDSIILLNNKYQFIIKKLKDRKELYAKELIEFEIFEENVENYSLWSQ